MATTYRQLLLHEQVEWAFLLCALLFSLLASVAVGFDQLWLFFLFIFGLCLCIFIPGLAHFPGYSPFFSRWWAVRTPQYSQISGENEAGHPRPQLCADCQSVLHRALLLTGSAWVVVRAVEWHKFQHLGKRPDNDSVLRCRLCTIFVHAIKSQNACSFRSITFSGQSSGYGTFEAYHRFRRSGFRLKIFQPFNEEGSTYMQLHSNGQSISQVYKVREGFTNSMASSESRSMSTGSDTMFEVIRKWVKGFSTLHLEGCRQQSQFQPSRLVYVASAEDPIKILTTADTDRKHQPYTVLSHCWGSRTFFTLKTDDQEEFSTQGISISRLPRNFQDAIITTLKLGYHLIWIDSLCIVQDSREDWEAESRTIGEIYSNAICTISATASQDSDGGCFSAQDSALHTDCILMSSNRSVLYISPETQEQRKSLDEIIYEKVDEAPISQRGWIFQEKLLSPRIIHFCEGVIMFECNSKRATNFEPNGEPYETKNFAHRNGRMLHLDGDEEEEVDEVRRKVLRLLNHVFLKQETQRRQERRLQYLRIPDALQPYSRELEEDVQEEEDRQEDVTRQRPDFAASAQAIMHNAPDEPTGTVEDMDSLFPGIRTLHEWDRADCENRWKEIARQHPIYWAANRHEINIVPDAEQSGHNGVRGALDAMYSSPPLSLPRTCDAAKVIERHRRWYELVSEYSARSLTKPSDRLAALAGLADRIEKKTGMTYILGLWYSSLVEDLLWMVASPPSTRIEGYVAPSWSWASVDGKVESALARNTHAFRNAMNTSLKHTWHIDVRHVEVEVAGQRETSATGIHRSHIRLRGKTKPVHRLSDLPIIPDIELNPDFPGYMCLLVYAESYATAEWHGYDELPTAYPRHPLSPTPPWVPRPPSIQTEDRWWGILLRPTLNGEHEMLERCGVAVEDESCGWTREEGWDERSITIT